ncbi:hypothetical protein [Nitrosomonas sp. Nm132]|jgi:hypothetical protein|uniref:hypothetical protein n=1 Tax=Nitrosomonas sp. Nm132 TaxID=1881053 RepID=UPI00088CD496|nr:hypothetical protein [Nitrosomonas sp. Nm132]SDG84728.1 hypothetical protein SAMN05428952_1001104 [Nitrosomonas sp. Nm132]
MTAIWQNLSILTRRLMIAISTLMGIILIGMQFHVSSQGDMSETYPKGFRGGTCTIESDTLLIGYSAYFIPKNYEIPQDALSAMSVPILCGKVPSPGILSITIDLLYPVSARERSVALSLFREVDGELGKALFSIPAKNYHSGSISHEIHVDEPGEYVLHLSGVDENQLDFRLVIPITVGPQWYEGIVQFWPLLLLCAAAVSFYNFRRIFD